MRQRSRRGRRSGCRSPVRAGTRRRPRLPRSATRSEAATEIVLISTSVAPGRAPARTPSAPSRTSSTALVVGERGHADVRLDERVRRSCEHGRAALPERLGAAGGAVEDGERVARVEDPLGDRLAHLPEADDCDPRLRHNARHPPSTSRLTPFTPPFSSRKSDASTISSIVTVRPIGVRAAVRSSTSGLAAHSGRVADDARVDRVDADRRELDRQRADEARDAAVHRRDRRRAGVGPSERLAAEEQDRGVRREARRERVHDLRVPDELERDEPDRARDVVLANVVLVALDRGEHEVLDRADGLESRARSSPARRGRSASGVTLPARDPGGRPRRSGRRRGR